MSAIEVVGGDPFEQQLDESNEFGISPLPNSAAITWRCSTDSWAAVCLLSGRLEA
jgi:hypothetical protein